MATPDRVNKNGDKNAGGENMGPAAADFKRGLTLPARLCRQQGLSVIHCFY